MNQKGRNFGDRTGEPDRLQQKREKIVGGGVTVLYDIYNCVVWFVKFLSNEEFVYRHFFFYKGHDVATRFFLGRSRVYGVTNAGTRSCRMNCNAYLGCDIQSSLTLGLSLHMLLGANQQLLDVELCWGLYDSWVKGLLAGGLLFIVALDLGRALWPSMDSWSFTTACV